MLILYLFCLPQGKNGLSTTCTTLNNVGVICFLVNHLYLVIIKFGIFNVKKSQCLVISYIQNYVTNM